MRKIYELTYRLNHKLYYQLRYFKIRKKFINFNHPSNLSEYLLEAMTKPDFAKYAPYADKVKVRDFVTKKGYGSILPELYGVWQKANDIDFYSLPDKFALKTNHGCGNHVICHNKSTLNIKDAVESLNDTLSRQYNITEPHYKYISPCVFAEEFIDDGKGKLPIDYKFMCVNGNPMCVLACSERGDNTQKNTYSTDWEPLPWTTKHCNDNIPRPKHLAEMIQIAKDLSKDFEFVRVDLYDCPSGVVFGELTFSPAEGFLSTFTTMALEIMNPQKHSQC